MLKLTGVLTLLSPLAHNSDEPVSTEATIRREVIFKNGIRHEVPVYSGNAFRGMMRRVLASHLLDTLGCKIGKEAFWLLYSGGALNKGDSTGALDVAARNATLALMPNIGLLGGCVGSSIVPGALEVGIARPICEELDGRGPSYHEATETVFYTRRDDNPLVERGGSEKEKSHQMKYGVECLVAGMQLQHQINVRSSCPKILGALGLALRLIQERALGGMARVGHGRFTAEYTPQLPDPSAYVEHIESNRDAMIEWLAALDKPAKAASAKKPKAKTPDASQLAGEGLFADE